MGPGPGLWNGTSEVLKSVSHETYLDLGEATLRIHEALSLCSLADGYMASGTL